MGILLKMSWSGQIYKLDIKVGENKQPLFKQTCSFKGFIWYWRLHSGQKQTNSFIRWHLPVYTKCYCIKVLHLMWIYFKVKISVYFVFVSLLLLMLNLFFFLNVASFGQGTLVNEMFNLYEFFSPGKIKDLIKSPGVHHLFKITLKWWEKNNIKPKYDPRLLPSAVLYVN